MNYSIIILAAGSGVRTGLDYNKIFHQIKGKSILDYSVDYFKKDSRCNQIIMVCSNNDFNYVYDTYSDDVDTVLVGGKTRQESVYNGLSKVTENYVLIHDSARPYLPEKCINDLLEDVVFTKASTLAVYVKDSIVQTNTNRLEKMLDRSKLLAIQTPQAFKTSLIKDAHAKARKYSFLGTDDTSLVSRFTDVMPSFVLGDYRNIKLTTIEDIRFLEVLL